MTKTVEQQIDEVLARIITRETHKGSVNRMRLEARSALLALFDQFAEDVIGEDDYQRTGRNGTLQSDRNQLRQEQRSRKQQLLEVKEDK